MPLSALKHAYDTTLLENTSTLVQVESALRNLTWFLPGRFQDAELASEGVYSALSLVSLYHDLIISRRLAQINRLPASPFRKSGPGGEDAPRTFPDDPLVQEGGGGGEEALGTTLPLPSDHTRYTSHFARTSGVYKHASRALVVLGYVQLLVEMMVVRGRGNEGEERREQGRWRRWRVLVWLEAVKTALRLSLLITTRRPLLAFPLPQREIDPSVLTQPDTPSPASPSPPTPQIPLLPSHTAPAATLLPLLPRLPEPYQPPAATLLPTLTTWREYLGEALHASEGLVAVLSFTLLARRRRRRRRRQPGPQSVSMASLALDSAWTSLGPILCILASRTLRVRRPVVATPLLLETYAARDRALAFQLVKGAIWQRWTRGKVMRLVGALEKVWGVRLVAGIVRDHVALVDEYYYYTAA
ncbi:hypothetical protein NliqN6_2226 [Naganishia liquefaciens]|uniref:Peroxisomal membrane protein PEX16 n=1 Tax=Naganishia liquefaciens TaxID=104408 RepID=A0A8H3YDX6_9TREE|nr:hypothetical protein NliqN6_2226 [Naganishia liquefaciens]